MTREKLTIYLILSVAAVVLGATIGINEPEPKDHERPTQKHNTITPPTPQPSASSTPAPARKGS